MSAIVFYLAWVDASETTWSLSFARHDEQLLSFDLKQDEGDFAALTVEARNPRIGLLSPGRKVWAWLSYDAGAGPAPLFFGRLVGIPTSIFDEVVTLDFVARPADFDARKRAAAEALKVLPEWDPSLIDPQQREDPDLVLEARAAVWHIDRITHAVSHSGYVTAEDGTLTFLPAEMLWDGLKLALKSVPLRSVGVDAAFAWTQLAQGGLDFTSYLVGAWPNDTTQRDIITSYTFEGLASSWPKSGATLAPGWTVTSGTCETVDDLAVKSKTGGSELTIKWGDFGDAGTTSTTVNTSDQYIAVIPPGSFSLNDIVTKDDVKIKRDEDGDISSFSRHLSYSDAVLPLGRLRPTLTAAYAAKRPCTEHVTFTLSADVQPLVTLASGEEALMLPPFRTVNLSEDLDQSTAGEAPIGDARRRSYLATDRGREALAHLLLVARAHLVKRARAVEITFATTFARAVALTLRQSALIFDPRLPGGSASGKIIFYRIALSGDDGKLDCTLKIGCAVGYGGSVVDSPGEAIYVDDDYIGPDEDWQEYSGQVIAVAGTVGFTPPLFAPADDGVDFIRGVTVADVLADPLTVTFGPAAQRAALINILAAWGGQVPRPPPGAGDESDPSSIVAKRVQAIDAKLAEIATVARFRLKSMQAEFTTEVPLVVTALEIPKQIDLEAA